MAEMTEVIATDARKRVAVSSEVVFTDASWD